MSDVPKALSVRRLESLALKWVISLGFIVAWVEKDGSRVDVQLLYAGGREQVNCLHKPACFAKKTTRTLGVGGAPVRVGRVAQRQ
jgi:hypothetical protein